MKLEINKKDYKNLGENFREEIYSIILEEDGKFVGINYLYRVLEDLISKRSIKYYNLFVEKPENFLKFFKRYKFDLIPVKKGNTIEITTLRDSLKNIEIEDFDVENYQYNFGLTRSKQRLIELYDLIKYHNYNIFINTDSYSYVTREQVLYIKLLEDQETRVEDVELPTRSSLLFSSAKDLIEYYIKKKRRYFILLNYNYEPVSYIDVFDLISHITLPTAGCKINVIAEEGLKDLFLLVLGRKIEKFCNLADLDEIEIVIESRENKELYEIYLKGIKDNRVVFEVKSVSKEIHESIKDIAKRFEDMVRKYIEMKKKKW